MPATSKGTTIGSSVSGPKVQRIERSGRTQRRLDVPSASALANSESGGAERAPQRIDVGHGKLRITSGTSSATTSSAARPGFSRTAT
jgi:hypothetical protein